MGISFSDEVCCLLCYGNFVVVSSESVDRKQEKDDGREPSWWPGQSETKDGQTDVRVSRISRGRSACVREQETALSDRRKFARLLELVVLCLAAAKSSSKIDLSCT